MSKVELSGRIDRPGGSDEKVTVHRNADRCHFEGGGCRHAGEGDLRKHASPTPPTTTGSRSTAHERLRLKRLKEMEQELSQLKRMYADMALENGH